MNLATRAVLSVGALAVIAGAAFFGAKEAAVAVLTSISRTLRAGNSPIMASGGSMTFRSAVGWTCDSGTNGLHQVCITSKQVGIGSIVWDNVIPDPDNNVRTLGWTGLSKPWDLTMTARANGNNGRVRICTTSTADVGTAKCDVELAHPPSYTMSYLLLTLKGASANSGAIAFIESKATDYSGKITAVQYYDSKCYVHEPDPSTNVYAVADCEHPGKIETSLDQSDKYHCVHGACEIGFDQ